LSAGPETPAGRPAGCSAVTGATAHGLLKAPAKVALIKVILQPWKVVCSLARFKAWVAHPHRAAVLALLVIVPRCSLPLLLVVVGGALLSFTFWILSSACRAYVARRSCRHLIVRRVVRQRAQRAICRHLSASATAWQ
jgi:hypothetical protein